MPALEVANLVGWVMEYEDRVGAVGRLTRNGRFVLFGAVALSASRLVVFLVRYGIPNTASDFLGSWPAPRLAGWFGKTDGFYSGLVTEWHEGTSWSYGPILHLVTIPLFIFPDRDTAYRFLLFVAAGGFVVTGLLLVWHLRRELHNHYALAGLIFVVFNFAPALEALGQRNVELLELLLISAAFVTFGRRRDTATGLLVGLAAGVKFLPAVLIPALFLARRRRAGTVSLTTLAVIAIVTQLTLGWQNNLLLRTVVDVDSEINFFGHPQNQAIPGFIMRAVGGPGNESTGIAISIVVLISAGATLCFWLWSRRGSSDWPIQWSILLTSVLLLIPHGESYYLCLLIPPFAIAFSRLCGMGRTWKWVLFLVAYSVVAWPVPMSIVEAVVDSVVGRHIWLFQWTHENSIPMIGTLILLFLLFSLHDPERLAVSDQIESP